jgi:quercetin dioxygenase-like cupin family protein
MQSPRVTPVFSGDEIEEAPGFIVDRRQVFVGLGGLLTAGLPTIPHAATLSFEAFLARANAVAVELITDTSRAGQDRYLRELATLSAQLDAVPLPTRFNDTNQGDAPGDYQIGVNPGGQSFTVLHWRLEPGARCRPHAHTYGNVLSIGLEGLVRASNYEVVGVPDYAFGGTFRIRQTIDQLLGPGDVNLVSLQRNYIHGFVAGPDGARGLDITTRLKPRPEYGTPFLDIGASPVDEFTRTFDASWDYAD